MFPLPQTDECQHAQPRRHPCHPDARNTLMHVGLIGGIGPAATVAYYQRLADRCRDAEVALDLTIANTEIRVLAANAASDRRAQQAQVYARVIDRLAGAGAEVAAITSIGGSFCEDETREIAALPLVSAFAGLDAHFVGRGLDTVGILGAGAVMRTALFGRLARTRVVVPDENLAQVGQTYVDMAVSGRCTPTQRDILFAAGRAMIDRGAAAVVLAGTDLGLAFDGRDPGFPVIDALDVHVDQLFQLVSGGKTVRELAQ